MSKTHEAHAQLRREYYASVRAIAATLLRRLKGNEFTDAEHARTAIRAYVTGSHWSQTTLAAYQALMCSDNEAHAWSDLSAAAKASSDAVLVAANETFRLDVIDEIESVLVVDHDIDGLDEWFARGSGTDEEDDAQEEMFS